MRRMDRYNDNSNTRQVTRSNKNQELYENIGSNTRYTNFTDVTNANAFNLDEAKTNSRTREGYHRIKEYKNFAPQPKVKKELEEFKNLYQKENKVYDINSVLEEARKNRTEKDDLDEKRKLKNTSYNILTESNKELLEKYRQEKNERFTGNEEEDLRELIDTITTKTLAGEIDQATSVDLLSDLMATNILDRVDKPSLEEKEEVDEKEESIEEKQEESIEEKQEETKEETEEEIDEKLSLSKEILDKEQIDEVKKVKEETKEESESKLTGADTDFYTRSMDLSDQDFEMSDDFKEKKLPLPIKIILILVVLVVIAITAYFIWNNM